MIIKWKFNRTILLSMLFTVSFLLSCTNNTFHDQRPFSISTFSSLSSIIYRGKLVAVTDFGSATYFMHRGTPMGYQYELLKSFADHLGIRLEIHVEPDPAQAFERLHNGTYDLLAKGVAITIDRKVKMDFMNAMIQSRQVLVQRKPTHWRQMPTMKDVENQLIRDPSNLEGKTVHVPQNSAHYYRLVHLQQETMSHINVVEVAGKNTEDLMQMVDIGEIDYTIADDYLANIGQQYFPNLDVQTSVSLPQNISWAVGKGNETLLMALNEWWSSFENSTHAQFIYNRYFNNPKGLHAGQREYFMRKSGRISGYDDIVKKYSAMLSWDWRLLASLIYQESKFRNDVVSHAGAYGIMQMMPETAEAFGIDGNSSPQDHIAAGVKYLKWLDTQLKKEIADPSERQKFVLAAYNAGLAHVYDARRLAAKNDKNPNIWHENVDYYLLNKSNPEYYGDSVVRYGYCRGEEPYKFVIEVIDRFDQYKKTLKN